MKTLLAALLLAGILVAETKDKLYIHQENSGWTTFSFVQDLETGTRCYAATGVNSIAISCVPSKGGN